MDVMKAAVLALVIGAAFGASPALAGAGGEAAELENARANARAGGPISERDRELLERWGCLSGTNSAFCKDLERRNRTFWSTEKPRARRR